MRTPKKISKVGSSHQKLFSTKVIWKISQKLLENTCASLFLLKLQFLLLQWDSSAIVLLWILRNLLGHLQFKQIQTKVLDALITHYFEKI